MKFNIFLVTVGQTVVWETLESVKKYSPGGMNLTIWYHPLEKPDLDYWNRLCTYSDDVIMCTKNQAQSTIANFSMLRREWEWWMGLGADNVLKENYFDKLYAPFQKYSQVALSGCIDDILEHELPMSYVINDGLHLPDVFGLFKREAINLIGGFFPAFKQYGFEIIEWCGRAISKGWKIATVKDCYIHGGSTGEKHFGKHKTPNLQEITDYNGNLQIACDRSLYRGYNWWANKL